VLSYDQLSADVSGCLSLLGTFVRAGPAHSKGSVLADVQLAISNLLLLLTLKSLNGYYTASSIIWYQRKLGSKQAYHVVHQPVSHGLAVFADAWLSGWLVEISADLRETVAH